MFLPDRHFGSGLERVGDRLVRGGVDDVPEIRAAVTDSSAPASHSSLITVASTIVPATAIAHSVSSFLRVGLPIAIELNANHGQVIQPPHSIAASSGAFGRTTRWLNGEARGSSGIVYAALTACRAS